ncbi:MAG: hypothetical protein K6T75_08785 [Acetobacteraceae bacterium]|nr:hypothetical protein [Acetobacteraceae bacterium]
MGPASVGYLLFEVFHRCDALYHVSPWERKIYARLLLGEPDAPASTILDFARRWSGWRLLAMHCLFEDVFRQRLQGRGPEWLEALIRA